VQILKVATNKTSISHQAMYLDSAWNL